MAQLEQFNISIVGGLNVNDQGNSLVARSYTFSDNQFNQVRPLESPDLQNIDFNKQGFMKRKGSLEDSDLTGVMVASEVLIAGTQWTNPSTGAKIQIIVGKKSIYTNQSGSWAQINNSSSSAYTHSADVSKCTFAEVDGHLFIGLDGANPIQVYKSGADLDPPLVTSNTYENAFGAGTNTITGAWGNGFYLLASVNSRLVYSDGNTLVYYSPMSHTASSGIWDGTNAGFFQAVGNVHMLASFVPHFSDSLSEKLYIGTSSGFEVTTGFTTGDSLVRIKGSKSPLNHQSFARSKNWLVYLTDDNNIMAINGARVIDLGRRLKAVTGDGPLDDMSVTDSSTSGFGFYNSDKEQVMFHFSTSSARFNDTCIVLDFKLGEPVIDEAQTDFEARVRLLVWKITSADTNDWFAHIYRTASGELGITKVGKTYTINTLNDDLIATGNTANLLVDSYWKSPVFFGGGESISKQWMMMLFRSIIQGNWPLSVDVYLNRSDQASKTWSFDQAPDEAAYGTATYGTAQYSEKITIRGSDDTDLYSEAVQWKIYNATSEQSFIMTNQTLKFIYGAEER